MRENQINDRSLVGFGILMAIFISAYLFAPILANKILQVGPLAVAGGVIAYSITFPVTDIITEVYGRKYAKLIVTCGFIAQLVVFALIQLVLILPAADFWQDSTGFIATLNSSSRIVIASLTAYLTSQYIDIWVFAVVRRFSGNRYLWLRNNISTCVSKLLDTILFLIIAFYGIYTNAELFTIIASTYLIHVVIAFLDTPLVYLGVWAIHKHSPELKTIEDSHK